MLETILQTADTPSVQCRMEWGTNGVAPTYRLLAWRTGTEDIWQEPVEAQSFVTDSEIIAIEKVTGWKMDHFTQKLNTFEWVHKFNRVWSIEYVDQPQRD